MFTPSQILRRQMTIYPICAGIAIVAFWLAYLLAAAFDLDLVFGGAEDAHATWYLLGALLATLLIPAILLSKLRLTRNLIRRGVSAQAVVAKIAAAQQHGRQHVTVAYTVNGQRYTAAAHANVDVLNQYTPATRVPVIYDPADPSKSQAFPNHALVAPVPEASILSQTSGELVNRVALAGLFFGQMIVLLLLLGTMSNPYLSNAGIPAIFAALALTLFEMMMWEKYRGYSGPGYQANLRVRKIAMAVFALVALISGPLALYHAAQVIQTTSREADERAAERKERANIINNLQGYQDMIGSQQRK